MNPELTKVRERNEIDILKQEKRELEETIKFQTKLNKLSLEQKIKTSQDVGEIREELKVIKQRIKDLEEKKKTSNIFSK